MSKLKVLLITANLYIIYKYISYVRYTEIRGAYYKPFDWFKILDIVIIVFVLLITYGINEIFKVRDLNKKG